MKHKERTPSVSNSDGRFLANAFQLADNQLPYNWAFCVTASLAVSVYNRQQKSLFYEVHLFSLHYAFLTQPGL
jgi:hypothetical protein